MLSAVAETFGPHGPYGVPPGASRSPLRDCLDLDIANAAAFDSGVDTSAWRAGIAAGDGPFVSERPVFCLFELLYQRFAGYNCCYRTRKGRDGCVDQRLYLFFCCRQLLS